MITSTVLGVLTAQAFRRRFRGSDVIFYSVILGMIVPGVLLGLGMALLADQVGMIVIGGPQPSFFTLFTLILLHF